jgi:branched-chain amino acid aminotransferase
VKAWVQGQICAQEEARVPLMDHGITVGDAVFETVAVRRGAPVCLSRHLERMVRSCGGLGIPVIDVDALRGAAAAVISANAMTDGLLRILHTSGPGPLGSHRGDRQPTTAVLAGPLRRRDPAADVAMVPWPRNERAATAGLKTTSYAENVIALAYAEERGCSEALFANTRGELCEGSGSNVFLVLDARLVTPSLSTGCLAGVSRGLLIERCGLDVVEAEVPVAALAEVREAFLTSATRDVQPIRRIDGRALPDCPGPLTSGARRAYAALLRKDPDPA